MTTSPPRPTSFEAMSVALRGVEALVRADSPDEAFLSIASSLEALGRPEYMVSLLTEEAGDRVIKAVPEYSSGQKWLAAAPHTLRVCEPATDILPITLLDRKQSRFVFDSRHDPEGETDAALCRRCGIVSQYVVPIRTESMEIGTLQVDMGECRQQPTEECDVIDALVSNLALVIERITLRAEIETAHHDLLNQGKLIAFDTAAAHIMHDLKERMTGYLSDLHDQIENHEIRANKAALEFLKRSSTEIQEWSSAIRRKIASAAVNEKVAEYDVDPIVQEVIDVFHRRAALRGCKLEGRLDSGARAYIRRGALVELLTCLFMNAIEAYAKTIVVSIDVDDAEHGEDESSSTVAISVLDNGNGIPADIKNSIFSYGFTTKSVHGHGMGLLLARLLARDMGGDLELKQGGRAAGDRRTEFVCRLPNTSV